MEVQNSLLRSINANTTPVICFIIIAPSTYYG